MSTETEPVHFVTVEHEHDDDGDITVSRIGFECRGTIDSPCHLYPDFAANPDIENFGEVDESEWIRHEDCWLADWFDQDVSATPYDAFDGGPIDDLWAIPAGSGPIDYEYDECIFWHWVDGPVPQADGADLAPQAEQFDLAAEVTR